MAAISESLAGLGGLIFIFVLIAQFLAYFNYSNIAQVIAVQLSDILERANIATWLLLTGFVILVFVIDFLMPGVIRSGPSWLRSSFRSSTVWASRRPRSSPATASATAQPMPSPR
jgi:aminobenzoyl-glutamate transport protein